MYTTATQSWTLMTLMVSKKTTTLWPASLTLIIIQVTQLFMWAEDIHHKPVLPFQKAESPSSLVILRQQSMMPLYVVWPARSATCSLVLMTSAGVGRNAAGIPEMQKVHIKPPCACVGSHMGQRKSYMNAYSVRRIIYTMSHIYGCLSGAETGPEGFF